jgi:23S rRNA (adenine1618-N6)-methyltransferase
MPDKKKTPPLVKTRLHPRNKHRARYDFKQLTASYPGLTPYVVLNKYNDESIDFSDPKAVKMLNSALLKNFYDINYWDVPDDYLCPPIPGRADYIHHIAEHLGSYNKYKPPTGSKFKCLDVGVGANCVYPIIGTREYRWSFIGADIDQVAINSVKKIVDLNPSLKNRIDLKIQENRKDFFYGVIGKEEKVDLTICNPPFHASLEAAQEGTLRKTNNLTHKKNTKVIRNFGGTNNELWCEGGERKFIVDMIRESKKFSNSVFMFSSLISKQSTLKPVLAALKNAEAFDINTIAMGQGNKSSRIVVWTFLNKEEQKSWVTTRWK